MLLVIFKLGNPRVETSPYQKAVGLSVKPTRLRGNHRLLPTNFMCFCPNPRATGVSFDAGILQRFSLASRTPWSAASAGAGPTGSFIPAHGTDQSDMVLERGFGSFRQVLKVQVRSQILLVRSTGRA